MKKTFFLLALCLLAGLGGFSRAAHAWEDGETFGDKWRSYWKGVGRDLDTAGQNFCDTFLKPNSDN